MQQLASFRRDFILKHAADVPGLADHIITEDVDVVTFDDIYAGLQSVPNVIVMDAEGYDWELIKLLDVPTRRPAVIHYEHKNLSVQDRNACLELLIGVGYRIFVGRTDTTAYREE